MNDPFKYETGPRGHVENEGSYEAEITAVRDRLDETIDRLATDLHMPRNDIIAFAVALFARYIDTTRDGETMVLVVKGTVAPYDNAIQAVLAGAAGQGQYDAILEYVEAKLADEKRQT